MQKGAALVPMHNASNGYAPTMNLRSATIQSSNTYFVGVEDQVFGCDLSPIVSMAKSLGVNSLNVKQDNGQTVGDNIVAGTQYTYTLGQTATSALEMASAYGMVANDGVYCPPDPIGPVLERVTGMDVVQDENKFVSSQTVDLPMRSEFFGQGTGEQPQCPVALGMAGKVVQGLEPVEIHQGQGQGGAGLHRS